MDQSQNELTGEGQPDKDEGTALSIEEIDRLRTSTIGDGSSSLTGATIGHYLVGERLGGGAMASVYRAQDQILDRSVAIKVLLPGADAVMQKRFRREARLVSGLLHPHIVRTLQVGRGGGIIYIAMELVEGVSLGELLERKGKLSVADAAHILATIAEALAYAHSKGIIHRDVKPSNILLMRANPGAANSVVIAPLPYPVVPLLSDFGIARAMDAEERTELTNAGRTIGTPAFMAPEQCAGSAEIDGRADIYALGAVLYRCLVGRPPFAGTTTQILHAHVYDPLLIPDEVAAALPAPVVRIMARAMKKEPGQRYEQVELMAAELLSAADLPLPPSAPRAAEVVDPTMTMASLPVTPISTMGTSRVLVPATPLSTRTSQLKQAPRGVSSANTSARAVAVSPIEAAPPRARKRSSRNGWGIMALGAAFVVLVLIATIILVNSILPPVDNRAINNPTSTPEPVAQQATPQQPPTSAVVVPGSVEVRTPAAVNTAPVQPGKPTPQPARTASIPTPEGEPTPAGDPAFAWRQSQDFYEDGQWNDALPWLIWLMRFVDSPKSPGIAPVAIERQRVREMLVMSYIGLATEKFKEGKWTEAISNLDSALKVAPLEPLLKSTRQAIATLDTLGNSNSAGVEDQRLALRQDLAESFARTASDLESQGRFCDAEFLIADAFAISVSKDLEDRHSDLDKKCTTEKANAAILKVGGNIIYSSERVDGSKIKDIWYLPVTVAGLVDQQSTRLIENGAQPQLSPNGGTLVYYNPLPGGLWGISMGAGLTPQGAISRYSSNAEDGKDAPARWNSQGDELIYSTSFRDPPAFHIYVTSADAEPSAQLITVGKDPAWDPSGQVLVYNGYLNNSPGLLTMRAGGSPARLTSEGSDQRPTWTPDGNSIVYMGKDHPGEGAADWEIYSYEWASGTTTRLSDGNSSQDGLPAVSPDGKWVAFMSDRGGKWQLWYVSIDGGPVHLLSAIAGQPIAWLEHAIQWVK